MFYSFGVPKQIVVLRPLPAWPPSADSEPSEAWNYAELGTLAGLGFRV